MIKDRCRIERKAKPYIYSVMYVTIDVMDFGWLKTFANPANPEYKEPLYGTERAETYVNPVKKIKLFIFGKKYQVLEALMRKTVKQSLSTPLSAHFSELPHSWALLSV